MRAPLRCVSTAHVSNASRFFHQPPHAPLQLGPKPNIHRSNAEELVARVPVVEVAGNTAMCDGGGGNMGHPSACPAAPFFGLRARRLTLSPLPPAVEYIELNRRAGAEPAACKYCGVRSVRAEGHYH